MAAVRPDHDQVGFQLLRHPVDLGLGPAENQMLMIFGNLQCAGELGKVRFGLLMNLFLDRREVHGNVAAVGETERFDHVNDVQIRVEGLRKSDCALGHPIRFFGKIDCQHDTFVCTHVVPHLVFARPYT